MTNYNDFEIELDPRELLKLPRNELIARAEAKRVYDIRKSKLACEESLIEFVRQSWHVIEPAQPFVDGWVLHAIAMHLEAVTNGEINRLLANVPPGFSKSTLTSVMWPAWEWGPRNMPYKRYLATSHSQNLAIRDSTKMRRLISSEWYQERWGDRVKLTGDQNSKLKFENTQAGFREATAFTSLTGVRASTVIIDDPHSVDSAASEAMRDATVTTFLEAVPTRLVDPIKSAIVVIMQRLHEGDVSGVIIEKNLGYTHLCLPMEYDPLRHCETEIGFSDPRTEEGELLFAERFPKEIVERDKAALGPYACNTGEAPVLMADLSLKRIDEIVEGDEILGWSKKEKGKSKIHRTKVEAVYKYRAQVVKMTLDSGEVIRCTKDHKWWTARYEKGRKEYAPANIGTDLARVCQSSFDKLSAEDERLAGWLSGFFDGEGTVSLCAKDGANKHNPSYQIHFYQTAEKNLPICEKLEYALDKLGFSYKLYETPSRQNKIGVTGNKWQKSRIYTLQNNQHSLGLAQKFMNIVKPVKWADRVQAMAEGSKFVKQWEKVISIEPDGEDDVYALTTGTGNYVVWGLASSNSAGQFQQAPSPRGGGIIKRDWWQLWDDELAKANGVAGAHRYPPMDYIIASLDTAYTEKKENDPSALTIWGVWQRGGQSARRILSRDSEVSDLIDDRDTVPSLMLMYAWEKRLPIHGPDVVRMDGETDTAFRIRQRENMGLVEHVIEACNRYNVDMLLIEAKASGISVAQEIKRLNRTNTWGVELINPGNADKVARAYAVQPIFSNGAVFAPDKEWSDKVITQFEVFPKGKHDDLVDSCTQALKYLRERNLIRRPEEVVAQIKNQGSYNPMLPPLYDV